MIPKDLWKRGRVRDMSKKWRVSFNNDDVSLESITNKTGFESTRVNPIWASSKRRAIQKCRTYLHGIISDNTKEMKAINNVLRKLDNLDKEKKNENYTNQK